MPQTAQRPAGCGHRECSPAAEGLLNGPNLLTALRTVAATLLALLALPADSGVLLAAAVATYWIGDVADGQLARRLGQETRAGAVLDIVCDRLCCACCYLVFLTQHPDLLVPVAIFLVQFMVVDNVLSLAFMGWPVSSPNYFYLVDRPIWVWNWSPLAKSVNSAALLLTMVVTGSAALSAALAGAVLCVKVGSIARLAGLPAAAPGQRCARQPVPVAASA